MRPAIDSTSLDNLTAWAKSPVTPVSAVRNRLPKLWPFSPPPAANRYWNSLLSSASSSDSATMQLRMSPGGSTSNSRRKRPELPPSSVTVTTAVMSTGERNPAPLSSSRGGRVYFFKPCSRAERPVPPPMATIRSGPTGARVGCLLNSSPDCSSQISVVRWNCRPVWALRAKWGLARISLLLRNFVPVPDFAHRASYSSESAPHYTSLPRPLRISAP